MTKPTPRRERNRGSATAVRQSRRDFARVYPAIRAAGQKGARNIANVVAATLGERISTTENGRRKRITKLDAAVTQLVNRAAGGDMRSLQLLLGLVQAIEARPASSDPSEPPRQTKGSFAT